MNWAVPELVWRSRGCPPSSGLADEVWTDTDGELLARGYTGPRGMSLEFPGLGTYQFRADTGPVSVMAMPGVPEQSITGTYWRSVLPFVLQARGLEALHASAAMISGKLAVLCAVSGTGKSTLARALARRGHQHWADDAVVLDRTRALPLPFQVKLRPSSSEWFREPTLSAFHAPDQPAELGAIFVLRRDPSSGLSARRLRPAEAFPRVLEHAYCFSLADPARKRDMVARYLDLAGRVPVLELRFAAGLEKLEAMADLVESGTHG